MTTLTKWTPFRELETFDQRIRQMFGQPVFGPFFGPLFPAADVYETDREFIIELEVPGFTEKELGVEVSDHTLRITGDRQEMKKETKQMFRLHERLEKAFDRRFALPPEVETENFKATFDKGVLTIFAPKTPETKTKTVAIEKS